MQQWEYHRAFLKWSPIKNDLVPAVGTEPATGTEPELAAADRANIGFPEYAQELGRAGWELVSMVAPQDMGATIVAVFKRPAD